MKKFLTSIITDFTQQKTSTKFWSILYLIAYIGLWVFLPEVFAIYQFFLFIIIIATALDGSDDVYPIFIATSLLMLGLYVIISICIGLGYVGRVVLNSFNEWLDKPKKEKDTSSN